MKIINIIKNKANTKFCLSLHYNGDNSYLFVNGKEIFKFKAGNKNVNFPTQFCLGSISNGLIALESREVSLNGNVYDFSVDYNFIDKSDILNIHKYLMTIYKMILSLFTVFLSFSKSLATKCLFLNDEQCIVRPTLIGMNPNELKHDPFIISLNICAGSCNI